MKGDRLKYYFIVALMIFASGAYAGGKKKRNNSSGVQTELEAKAESKFIKGMGSFLQQDYQDALKYFKDALELSPENAAIHFKIGQSYYTLDLPVKAVPHIEEAINLDPTNKFFYILLAEIYVNEHEYLSAALTYEKMVSLVDDANEYYFDIAEIYHQLGINEMKKIMLFQDSKEKGVAKKIKDINNKASSLLQKSLGAYKKIEQYYGYNYEITKEKQKIHFLLGNADKAFDEGKKIIKEFPEELQYRLSLAELYYNNNKTEEAIRLLQDVIRRNPQEPQPRLMIYEYYMATGQKEKATEQLETAFSSSTMQVEAKVKFISSLIRIPGYEDLALELSERTVATHREAPAYSILGDVYYIKGDVDNARRSYLKALSMESDKELIWQQVIIIDSKMKQYDSLITHSNSALEYFPESSTLWYYKGLGLQLTDKDSASIKAFEKGLRYAFENEKLKSQINANLGDVYYNVGEYMKSDSAYQKVLEYDPMNAHALNNYSYYLSLRGEKLEEARAMIEKAVRLHPNDPTYLDTYAWVLYKQGDFETALRHIEKALLYTQDPVVLDHYGDILFKSGRASDAVEQWEKAKEKGLDSKVIDQKIRDKKIYE